MDEVNNILRKKKRNNIVASVTYIFASIVLLLATILYINFLMYNIIFISLIILLLILGYKHLLFSLKISFHKIRFRENYLEFPYPISPLTSNKTMSLNDIFEVVIYSEKRRVMIRGREANVLVESVLLDDNLLEILKERGINVKEA